MAHAEIKTRPETRKAQAPRAHAPAPQGSTRPRDRASIDADLGDLLFNHIMGL